MQTAAPLQRIPGEFKGQHLLLLASEGDGSQEPTSQRDEEEEEEEEGPHDTLKEQDKCLVMWL